MKLDEPYNPNNIFAKILRGELPAIKLYEDEHTLSFMDIMPQATGHALVIPKSPATNLLNLDPTACGSLLQTTQKLAHAVQKAVDAPGILIAQLNGSAAGQTVPHLHFHVLPRHEGLELAFHARDVADTDELEAVAVKIRAALATL
jgi:histidine triad (HIT) family protein